jgi:peroxiredoxin
VNSGELPLQWGVTILSNDLIWWVPFAAMLYLAFKHHSSPDVRYASLPADQRPQTSVSSGENVEQFLATGTKLLVFVRHAGCTFCGETMIELASRKGELRDQGIEPVVVHMSPIADGKLLLDRAKLNDVVHISDPTCSLYRRFGLPRGKFSQLFGAEVWLKGFQAAILKGNKVGKLQGDGFQLGGAALLNSGEGCSGIPRTQRDDEYSLGIRVQTCLTN